MLFVSSYDLAWGITSINIQSHSETRIKVERRSHSLRKPAMTEIRIQGRTGASPTAPALCH